MDRVAPATGSQVPPPPEGRHPTGSPGRAAWTLVDCLVVFVLSLLLASVFGTALAALAGFPLGAGAGDGTGDATLSPDMLAVVSQIIFSVLLIALAFGWVRLRHRTHARRLLGRTAPGWRDVLIGLGLGLLATLVINVGLGSLIDLLARLFGAEVPAVQQGLRQLAENPATMPYFVVMAVVLAPLSEELFFRGMLLPAFARRLRIWGGIVLSAVLFALLHGVNAILTAQLAAGALTIGLIFPLGLLLGWIYHRRGTIAVPMLIHAVFNLLAVAGMLLL